MDPSTKDTSFSQNRAIVLHPDFKNLRDQASHKLDPFSRLEEAVGLALAIRLNVIHSEVIPLRKVHPGSLLGPGVIDRLKGLIADQEIHLVIIDSALGPIQQRNLERSWKCKVIDRTGLILEIFGERARTSEGRLQVELAALTYQRSRLVRSWTHLERQRGGLGFVGGPGETQLEVDRRLIDERLSRIKKELKTVIRTRELHRKSRRKVPYPIVALVGYTNTGKSTLFNRLTKSDVLAKDILFATLDPTMRSLQLPSGRTVILSDTVGFISDLPTTLVAAFRATLEEVIEADLLLHVRDASNPDSNIQAEQVMEVLEELGLENPNIIEVLNKVDQVEEEDQPIPSKNNIPISALTGYNLSQLLNAIEENLSADKVVKLIRLDLNQGAALSWLYDHGEVLNRDDHETETVVRIRMTPANLKRFKSLYKGLFKIK